MNCKLEKVEAHEYAEIENNYIEEIWRLFLAVENSKSVSERLSNYATVTYTEIIEIVKQ